MTGHQWLVSYLIVGLPIGIFLAYHHAQTLQTLLRGEEATIYGRNVVHTKKRADVVLEVVKDIRRIQHVVSDKVLAFIFALVLTLFCVAATFTWLYQMWKLSTYNCKMQIKETP